MLATVVAAAAHHAALPAPQAPASSAPEWIALAGAIFAALAACASWASVRLNRRQWLGSQQPYLSVQLVIERGGERVLNILNGGPGLARGVRFCVVAGEEFASGYAGPQFGGWLGPGQRAQIVLELAVPGGSKMRGVAVCWDGAERVHRFSDSGEHTINSRPRGPAEAASDPEEAFRETFGVDLLAGRRRVAGRGRTTP
jgi:hypothetical protein